DGDGDVEQPHRQPAGPGELLVVGEHEQRRAQPDPDREDRHRERDGQPQVGERHGGDRAEEVAVEVGRRPAGDPDEEDAAGDAAVEEQGEGEVAAGAAAFADDLDEHRPDDRGDDGARDGEHVPLGEAQRPADKPAERDAGEGHVPDPVAEQGETPLDEVGAHDRGDEADEDGGDEGPLHERAGEHLEEERHDSSSRSSGPPCGSVAESSSWRWRCSWSGSAWSAAAGGGGPSWTTRPWRRTTARSSSPASEPSSWRTTSTLVPRSRSPVRVAASDSWESRSIPASGSSRTRRSGRRTSARAMSTRCCWPPENTLTVSPARSARPTSSSASSARSRHRRGGRSRRLSSSPEETTSSAVAGVPDAAPTRCGTYPTRRHGTCRASRTSTPKSSTVPDVTGVTVRSDFTRVDLPEPLAPRRATNSPSWTSRSMPWRIRALPRVTRRSRTCTGGAMGPYAVTSWRVGAVRSAVMRRTRGRPAVPRGSPA